MSQSNQEQAANRHIYAANAHAAVAAAHRRGDHETAGELNAKAQEFSSNATVKTDEVAKRTTQQLRA